MPIDVTKLSPEEMEKLAHQSVPIGAPTFFAAAFNIQWLSNDAVIIFSRPQPVTLPPLGELAPFARNENVCVVHISASAMKDLSIVLAEQVAEYERITGIKISTQFTRSRDASKT